MISLIALRRRPMNGSGMSNYGKRRIHHRLLGQNLRLLLVTSLVDQLQATLILANQSIVPCGYMADAVKQASLCLP